MIVDKRGAFWMNLLDPFEFGCCLESLKSLGCCFDSLTHVHKANCLFVFKDITDITTTSTTTDLYLLQCWECCDQIFIQHPIDFSLAASEFPQ